MSERFAFIDLIILLINNLQWLHANYSTIHQMNLLEGTQHRIRYTHHYKDAVRHLPYLIPEVGQKLRFTLIYAKIGSQDS